MENSIILSNIHKSYNGKEVLSGFNCTFAKGTVNFVMGPSGQGKTTLMRILMGLEIPDSGVIKGMEGLSVGVVFQEDRLCENLSVSANIRMVQKDLHGEAKAEFIKKVEKILDNAGLKGTLAEPVHTLSGGMKRRVAIIRCILADRDVLIFDEALKGLDKESEKQFMEVIKPYLKGKTIIWVTHDESQKNYFNQVEMVQI